MALHHGQRLAVRHQCGDRRVELGQRLVLSPVVVARHVDLRHAVQPHRHGRQVAERAGGPDAAFGQGGGQRQRVLDALADDERMRLARHVGRHAFRPVRDADHAALALAEGELGCTARHVGLLRFHRVEEGHMGGDQLAGRRAVGRQHRREVGTRRRPDAAACGGVGAVFGRRPVFRRRREAHRVAVAGGHRVERAAPRREIGPRQRLGGRAGAVLAAVEPLLLGGLAVPARPLDGAAVLGFAPGGGLAVPVAALIGAHRPQAEEIAAEGERALDVGSEHILHQLEHVALVAAAPVLPGAGVAVERHLQLRRLLPVAGDGIVRHPQPADAAAVRQQPRADVLDALLQPLLDRVEVAGHVSSRTAAAAPA